MKQYSVTGMSCAACSARVEKTVSGVEGVTSCSVNLLTNSMGVEGNASPEDIIKAVQNAGYDAMLKTDNVKNMKNHTIDSKKQIDQETTSMRKRLIASLFFWLILMYVSMGHMMWGWPIPTFFVDNHVAMGILQLILTGIVMVINQKFFVSGFKSLWKIAPNMETLVALGAAAAFVYSTIALFAMTKAQMLGDIKAVMHYMHEFYFESAATILTLITVGKTLEAHSKGKTTDALKGLMKLAPKTATILENGEEKRVSIEEVNKGDTFVVYPGESIPVDGIVVEGSSAVDESSLTGESIPVDKEMGNQVSAGTINQSGFLRCQATRVGEDTTLSQIIQMVSDASATKAPIAKVADKVSGVFVPTVMLISFVTIVVWLIVGESIGFALARGISVLVISCPCALGLATPVAIMVGNGMGAKHGILFKTAVSLEKAGKAKTVVLDKTGTITQGKPVVTDFVLGNASSEKELLELAFALEQKSEHPLASAITNKAKENDLVAKEVEGFEALPGNGLTAILEGKKLCGGNYLFMKKQISIPEEIKNKYDKFASNSKTPLLFSYDGHFCGMIIVADTIKDDSTEAIKEMKNMGIRVVMLTGDNEQTANAIGKKAGVDEVIAGVLPNEKESVIRRLQQNGNVIMVGDGFNDAPALTSADIGMAIGAGADVAIDAADVVLMKSTLMDVPAAIRLSRATLKNIHEILFWAFFYNSIGIPLAAGVFIRVFGWQLNPMFAAAAMSLSSVSVVVNALRLNFFQMYKKSKNRKEDKNMEKTIKIEGMMCGHCEMHVKKALEALEGVEKAEVSHETGTAVVTLVAEVSDEVLKQAIVEAGYTVQ